MTLDYQKVTSLLNRVEVIKKKLAQLSSDSPEYNSLKAEYDMILSDEDVREYSKAVEEYSMDMKVKIERVSLMDRKLAPIKEEMRLFPKHNKNKYPDYDYARDPEYLKLKLKLKEKEHKIRDYPDFFSEAEAQKKIWELNDYIGIAEKQHKDSLDAKVFMEKHGIAYQDAKRIREIIKISIKDNFWRVFFRIHSLAVIPIASTMVATQAFHVGETNGIIVLIGSFTLTALSWFFFHAYKIKTTYQAFKRGEKTEELVKMIEYEKKIATLIKNKNNAAHKPN